ncbi:dihydrofolate reductase [Marasmius fiardii PR-910]|nr:dihydrofolate reductase [Marasmius fiardii PR-910]
MSRLTLIVAATKNNGIGQESRLPWRLPKEMSYFAKVTSSAPQGRRNVVVMGRNTWESIPTKFRPLSNRINVVITRQKDYNLGTPENDTLCITQQSYEEALRHLQNIRENVHRSFIIGGATVYSESLKTPSTASLGLVDRVLLTRIISPAFEECDVFMPDFLQSCSDWTRATHQDLCEWVGFDVPEGVQEEKGVKYEFQLWTREPLQM